MEKISEKELVERFGNSKQKEKYEKEGKLVGDTKRGVLRCAQKYCTVVSLGNGTYKLTNQKKVAIVPDFIKTANGVYSYTCPLIAQYIMNNEKTILGKISLAGNIKMISEFYTSLNCNPNLTAEEFELDHNAVYDYLKNTTKSINYCIDKTLEYLKKMSLILYKSNYLIVRGESAVNKNGVSLNVTKSIATDDDVTIYKEAIKEADVYASVKNDSERYYSHKARAWNEKFHEILDGHGIMNVFPVYEIWTVHPDRCAEYRNQFASDADLIRGLGKEFKEKIYGNMIKRLDNGKILEDQTDDFLLAYEFLSKICIGEPRLSKKTKEIVDKLVSVQEAKKYTLEVKERYDK